MKITKLFAVGALMMGAGIAQADSPRTTSKGRPACGNTMSKGGDDDCVTELGDEVQVASINQVRAAARKLVALAPKLKAKPVVAVTPAVVVDAPRVLANGRPACGNVQRKSKSPMKCEVAPAPTTQVATAKVTK